MKVGQKAASVISLLAVALLAGLTACGGGSRVAGTSLGEGGTSGTGVFAASVAKGTISRLDGLSTGGINYNINGATISFNGQPGQAGQLETGMIVSVSGQVNDAANTGQARSIVFAYQLAGTVDSINGATRTIVALGQQIRFDEYTTFNNTSAGSLVAGDVIQVSGFTQQNGELLATYIEKPVPASSIALLEGVVSQLDTSSQTFLVGNQLVSFAGAAIGGNQGAQLADDMQVRLQGVEVSDSRGVTGSIVNATLVEVIDAALAGNPNEDVRLEGLITRLNGATGFAINSNSILVSSSTSYTNGVAADVGLNTRVFVKGRLDAQGSILADEVRFIPPAQVTFEARVDSVDAAGSSLSVFGKTVLVDVFTLLQDNSVAAVQNFTLSDIAVGDRVKVSGLDNGQSVTAVRVERVDAANTGVQGTFEGVVDAAISDPVFSVAGVSVDTSSLQDMTGFSQGGITPVSRAAFFRSLQPGMVVRVTGDVITGSLTADHVQIVHCCNWEVYDTQGGFVGGGNDVSFSWDGTFNTDVLSTNVNATLSTNALIVGESSVAQDVRIFGPGSYQFDTGLDPSLSTNFGTTNLGGSMLQLTVGPGQVGAHVLFHFGAANPSTVCGKNVCNIDVVFLWDINRVYTGSVNDDSNLGAKGQIFNLSAQDGDGDGIPGIKTVDGPFTGFSTVYNLNYTSP